LLLIAGCASGAMALFHAGIVMVGGVAEASS
jgi:hypothetical protein